MHLTSPHPLKKTLLLLALSSAVCLPGLSHAQSIAVPNFSFENPTTAGFTNSNANGVNPDVLGSFGFTGASNSSYGVEVGAGKFTTGLLGSQYGYINSNTSLASLTSPSLATVAAGTSYTFTLGLGQRADNSSVTLGQYTLNILLDGSAVATTTVNGNALGPVGTLNDFSVTFPNSSNLSAGDLSIQIAFNIVDPGDGSVTSGGPFDNARFEASAVPEPSTVSLLAGVSVALGVLYRRRRKHSQAAPVDTLLQA